MPLGVDLVEVYHQYNADTNVAVRITDGEAGCVGAVPGGYVAATVFPEFEAIIN